MSRKISESQLLAKSNIVHPYLVNVYLLLLKSCRMEASDKAIESLRKFSLESSYLGKTLARTIVTRGALRYDV